MLMLDRNTDGANDMALFDAMLIAPKTEQSKAAAIVARRGRAYKVGKRQILTLHVFSTAISDLEAVIKAYGGNYYPHSSGYQWSCSRRATLSIVAKAVQPLAHGGTYSRLAPLFELVQTSQAMPVLAAA
jgi:hypothetical protein